MKALSVHIQKPYLGQLFFFFFFRINDIGSQGRLRETFTSLLTPKSIHCFHTQSTEVDR